MSFVLRIFNSGMCSCLTFSLSASKKLFNSLTSVGAQQEIKATSCHRNFFPVCIQTLCCWVCGEKGLCHGSVELSRQREAPALPEVGGLNPTGSWRGGSAEQQMFLVFPQKIFPEQSSIQEFKLHKRQTSCTEQKPFYGWQEWVCIFIHYMQFKHECVRCPRPEPALCSQ